MVNSQNGWPVNPPRRPWQVTPTVRLVLEGGYAGELLSRFASDFDRFVEDIDTAVGGTPDDWGWADRDIRGSNQISNHASATAIDLNALRHGLGAVGTFTADQRTRLRALLVKYSGVIRWGGDYTGRKDEMHFEICRDVNAVKAALARLDGEGNMADTLQEILTEVRRTNDMLFEGGNVPGSTARGSVMDEVRRTNDMLFEGGNVPGAVAAGTIKAQITAIESTLSGIGSALAELEDAVRKLGGQA